MQRFIIQLHDIEVQDLVILTQLESPQAIQ